MARKIFIDTEFTDFFDCHLISLGMVAASGEEFYAELPYPDAACSAFVREGVIPLLGAIPNAECSFEDLGGKVLEWLQIVRDSEDIVEICFDFQTDWDLFEDALDYRVPRWCRPRLVGKHIDELLRYSFHKKNGLPEHHALYDARANCFAFQEPSAGGA
ncbi:hypothetical protein ACTOWA_06075 [Herbaspirillum seropedicae]|uniref:hypothetical protein n=1 Tax=Herbaspirillum seropedicae TaxID=964 RepID=UPI003F8D0F53